MTEKEIEDLKKLHDGGLRTLIRNFPKEKLLTGCVSSAILSIAFCSIFAIIKADVIIIIKEIINNIFTILPNLIGFLLGGFAIIVGFGNKDFLKQASKPLENRKLSLYQTYSHVFSFSLIILTLTLATAFLFNLISKSDIVVLCHNWVLVINYTGLILLLFLMILSLLSIIDMIINVFNFAQAHHLTLFVENHFDENQNNNSQE